jgi:cell division septum initiation protein DivIVA
MSETATGTTELTSQYSAQVAGDLERNLKEQERLSGEIEGLQAQLAALRHDHTVLVNIQQALGVPATTAAPEPVATVPAARKKAAGASGTAKKSPAARKRTGAKAAAASSTSLTLVDFVREHLAGQSEPRSAAEITTALGQQHPERTNKTTDVRTTLEGLVAKSQAQRTKQGASVFYTAPDATQPAPAAQTGSQPEPASP